MSKRPGRKPQSSLFRKRQLSSEAKIIIELIKNQPLTQDELRKNTKLNIRTFYRINAFLLEQNIIKYIDGMCSLWNFDTLEKKIEDAISKLLREGLLVYPINVVNEVGKPWHEIEAVTYKVVEKRGLTITTMNGETVFLKTN